VGLGSPRGHTRRVGTIVFDIGAIIGELVRRKQAINILSPRALAVVLSRGEKGTRGKDAAQKSRAARARTMRMKEGDMFLNALFSTLPVRAPTSWEQ